MKKHPEDDDTVNNGLCEISREIYRDKIKAKFKKRKRKAVNYGTTASH
jgi:hypothetical protein